MSKKKLETVKVCVKCHKTVSGKVIHCPYCGGTLIKKVVHHR
jgi:RNA polymerase subunit RPABC4/transcription elongation factor Spt4